MSLSEVFESRARWCVELCDCRFGLACLPDQSVDAIVCDPPYELGFMGRRWDKTGIAFDPMTWAEVLRVAKPGAHLLAFGGTRTWHRIAVAIEDAGWQVRDSIAWLFASGFPKSLDVSKEIDKRAGHWRGRSPGVASENVAMGGPNYLRADKGGPITAAAAAGFGTALKPAFEPIIVARKPLAGTVADTFIRHCTGALNIDACRIAWASEADQAAAAAAAAAAQRSCLDQNANRTAYSDFNNDPASLQPYLDTMGLGRWPANVCLDEAMAAELDEQSGDRPGMSGGGSHRDGYAGGMFGAIDCEYTARGDTGGASRFFFCAKASRDERDAGLEEFAPATGGEATGRIDGSAGTRNARAGAGRNGGARNTHPTVKPVDLMRWLVRLVCPPGGIVLDPFAGSGTTGVATMLEGDGRRFVGFDMVPLHVDFARARIAHVIGGPKAERLVKERMDEPVQRSLFDAAGGVK